VNFLRLTPGILLVNWCRQSKSMVTIMRTIAFIVALLGLTISPYAAGSPAGKIHRVFDINRSGDKIGTEMIDIEQQDDTITVKAKTNVSVKILFVEAYSYELSSTEVWKNGQLIAFKSHTNDNGTKHSVEVTAANDKLSMVADGKHSDLPKSAVPASLWRKETVRPPDVFEPDTGNRLSLKMTDLGTDSVTVNGVTHQAHHYKIADTLKGTYMRELWYDGDVLVRIKLIGSDNSVVLTDLR
jgi:Family of unknown function (DUF6134)